MNQKAGPSGVATITLVILDPPAVGSPFNCGADKATYSAYGTVNPANCTLTAWMEQNQVHVGQCTVINPIPPNIPGNPNWGYKCTGIPAGTVTFFIKASTGGQSLTVQRDFSCQQT